MICATRVGDWAIGADPVFYCEQCKKRLTFEENSDALVLYQEHDGYSENILFLCEECENDS